MDTPEFPSNSEAGKQRSPRDKKVTQVVSGGASRRRKSFRKQFSDSFVAGDMKSTIGYVLFDVLLPAAQDMVIESIGQGAEKLFRGNTRRRGYLPPYANPTGQVSYNRISPAYMPTSSPQRALSRRARSSHNFDEIVLDQRIEAEEVIDRLFDLVSRYGTASVADLYELVGLAAAHTDNKWGWKDLSGAGVSRVRGGYLLDLPDPQPLG